MSKLKRVFILIIAASMVPFSAMATEQGGDSAPVMSQAQFQSILQSLPEKISGYSLSPSQAISIARDMATNANNKPLVQFGQKWFFNSLQAFITAFVLVSVGEVHNVAHERNLQLTPENVKQLSDEVTAQWTLLKQTGYKSTDAILMFVPSQGLNYLAAKTVNKIFTGAATQSVLKSLVAGTVLSIGLNYVTDMINVSAEYVLDHDTQFGGLSNTEVSILKLLQVRSGISYFLHGLVAGGPETRSAHHKVFKALEMMLFYDSVLRETLFSHMTREALLKGNNLTIVGMSILSSLISNKVMPAATSNNLGTIEKLSKSIGVSMVVALVSSAFIPNWFEDTETFALRAGYAHEKTHNGMTSEQLVAAVGAETDPIARERLVGSYLKYKADNREYNFVMYASLLKLTLDRMDSLEFEKEQIKKIEAAQVAQPNRETLGQKITSFPGKAFYDVLGGDILSPETKLKEDDHLLSYYQKMFQRAAADLSDLYSSAASEFNATAQLLPAQTQGEFLQESQRMGVLLSFTNSFAQVLAGKWSAQPPIDYWGARQALDQISFWGWNESNVLTNQGAPSTVAMLQHL